MSDPSGGGVGACAARRVHPYSSDYHIVCEKDAGHEPPHTRDDCEWEDDSPYALTVSGGDVTADRLKEIEEQIDAARIVVMKESGGALDHPALDEIEKLWPMLYAFSARAEAAEARAEQLEGALRERVASAEWVARTNEGMPASELVSLCRDPNREDWFEKVLPDLDYEIKGGTWDEPLWAWVRHPWYEALNLTTEECVAALAATKEAE